MLYGIAAVNVPPIVNARTIGEVVKQAEQIGFESVWTVEHLVLTDPQVPPSPLAPRTPLLEPLTTLTYLAGQTSTIRLCTGVLILPLRNPVVLAKQVASLDVLSGGRVTLGIGVGYVDAEFRAIGVPFEDRGTRCDEYIAAMRALWNLEPPVYRGKYVSFSDIQSMPRPVQRQGPPIIVGGSTRRAYRRAVEWGQGWYGYGLTIREARSRIMALNNVLSAVERPDALGKMTITITPSETPDEDTVGQLADLGVNRINLLLPRRLDRLSLDAFFGHAHRLIQYEN
jgi:probable F420-dependent oxidoreductase